MENDKPDRPAWMNDEQYVIYRELRRIYDAMCDALVAKDHGAWLKLTMRLREVTRVSVPTIASHALLEFVGGRVLYELREDGPAEVHPPFCRKPGSWPEKPEQPEQRSTRKI